MSGQVPPTRMAQQIFKAKKKAAEGGHRLLKKKADALKVSINNTYCAVTLLFYKLSAVSVIALYTWLHRVRKRVSKRFRLVLSDSRVKEY